MSLDKVVEDILRRGREREAEIIRLGESERDEQLRLSEKKISEDRAKAERRNAAVIEQMERQEVSSAELESKKASLAAQREVMEGLKGHVLSELSRYPADKRKRLYSKLVSRAKKELGDCYVYSNKDDQAVLQLPPGMASGGTVDCSGGLVFESKDRAVRLDFRFETMLDEVWNKNMREIYSRLFG